MPRAGLDFTAERRAVFDNHVRETLRLAADVRTGRVPQPDVVIWPENSSDIDPSANLNTYARIQKAAQAADAPLQIGAVVGCSGPAPRNTAALGPGHRARRGVHQAATSTLR